MNVIDPYFGEVFRLYSPEQQARTIAALSESMTKLRAHDAQTIREMGIMQSDDLIDTREEVAAALVRCSWQMALLLRFSKPPRIDEAEEYVRAVLTAYAEHSEPGAVDVEPALYLAVILHRQEGREDEAYALYNAAVAQPHAGIDTRVWAQTAIARMLRRVGRAREAYKIEKSIVSWFKSNPAAMGPQALRALIADEENLDAPNRSLDDPVLKVILEHMAGFPDTGALLSSKLNAVATPA